MIRTCLLRVIQPNFRMISTSTKKLSELFYTKDHETLRINDLQVKVGISNYAKKSLGEIIFIEPEVELEETVEEKDTVFSIESVKATSELYSPGDGVITSINEELTENVELLQEITEEDLWLFEVQLEELDMENYMNKQQYQEYCDAE